MNKTILLSEIPVHKEQNTLKGKFFSLSSPLELAEQMEDCIKNNGYKSNYLKSDLIINSNKKDIVNFAINFQNIALDAVKILSKDS